MESVHENTETSCNTVSKSVPTTSVQLLGPNPYRVAIIVSLGVTQRYTISFDRPAVIDRGIQISTIQGPTVFNRHNVGKLITRPLYAISHSAPQIVSIVEVIECPCNRENPRNMVQHAY